MTEIFTVGETMAVMVPGERGQLRYNDSYRMKIAGAESNLAIGAAKLGHEAVFATKVGNDEIGQFMLRSLRAEGVNTACIRKDPQHATGLMFKEFGPSETKVYYYRDNSAAANLTFEDLDRNVLNNCRILHLTGITPVLSASCRRMVEELFAYAEKNNICISFDPNIRKRLWKGRDLRDMIRSYCLRAQILLMGKEEALELFGTEDCRELFRIISDSGNRLLMMALKDGSRGAVVSDGERFLSVPPYPCRPVDPVGAGDGFNAGFLCGILEGRSLELCGKMGAVCGALATQSLGDTEGYPDREQMDRILSEAEEIYR